MRYWHWFFRGSGGRSGISRFADKWLPLHALIGLGFGFNSALSLQEAANTVLLPLAGVLIGICFAWGGNALALLQTEEIEQVSEKHPGGFEEYLYVYQTAILLILTTVVCWGFAGLGIFDSTWPALSTSACYKAIRGFLFFMSSLTIRECWHVVLGTQSLLLVRQKVRKSLKQSSGFDASKDVDK
jgi:hypothetical protein